MAEGRSVIVNADDFGLSAGTNTGIIEAHERGIVTSASLMVRQPAAAQAAAQACTHPALSVGLHLDFGEWVLRAGEWVQTCEVVPGDDFDATEREVARQLAEFRRLLGRDPTHLDSHQHVHRYEPLKTIVLALGAELHLPVRDFTPGITYRGDFYGQGHKSAPFPDGISAANLLEILRDLPAGITELSCHPGADAGLESSYCAERLQEVKSLCDSRLRGALRDWGIALISFMPDEF